MHPYINRLSRWEYGMLTSMVLKLISQIVKCRAMARGVGDASSGLGSDTAGRCSSVERR